MADLREAMRRYLSKRKSKQEGMNTLIEVRKKQGGGFWQADIGDEIEEERKKREEEEKKKKK